MYIAIVVVFIVGYLLIALEHPIHINKAASALLTGVLCWTLFVFGPESIAEAGHAGASLNDEVLHHLAEIAQILFFLLGAMTIVELIDVHRGFEVITSRLTTTNTVKLLWIVGFTTFFFSAVLDNLTTSIVMAALLRKLIGKKEDLWLFAGVVIIAANAGGAWSPIGDVTTIMLWIGGQISAMHIITTIFLPSLVCLLVPLGVLTVTRKGEIERPLLQENGGDAHVQPSRFDQTLILWMGVLGLLFVPVFKNVTHLPPFMGMMFSLGVLWVTTEIMLHGRPAEERHRLSVSSVIRRVDTPSVLFFLGILLAVACLQTAGHLGQLATALDATFGNLYVINTLIGLLSSVVDNVPLVAGAMGMYPMSVYPQDHIFWELLTYCAGTGGSVLIIGSAAGVAIMGILNIDFIWYLKRISWLALIGYFAGIGVHYLIG